MTTPYTADALLEDVRRGASASSTAATGQADSDLLAYADAELRDTLIPLLLTVQEDYYERVFDQSIVSGTAAYRINKRAALSRINSVQYIGSANAGSINLQRIEFKRVLEMSQLSVTGQPWAYYMEGSRVVLFPTPSASATLRIRATVRPGRLTAYATTTTQIPISAVSGTTSYVLTVNPHAYTTATPLDVVSATPSFEYLAIDVIPTAVSTTVSLTLDATGFSTAPAVGDYVCATDTTPFIQLPVELHPALVELTIARLLRARGILSEAQSHAEDSERMVKLGLAALAPRVDTANRKMVGGPHFRRRGFGFLRGF